MRVVPNPSDPIGLFKSHLRETIAKRDNHLRVDLAKKKISSILRLVCSLFSYCSQSFLLLFFSVLLLVREFLVFFELVDLGFFPLNYIMEHQTASGYLGCYFCS